MNAHHTSHEDQSAARVLLSRRLASAERATLQVVHSLAPLQSVVLRTLAAQGDNFAPYEAQTMESYRALLEKLGLSNVAQVDVPNVQVALDGLREKNLIC